MKSLLHSFLHVLEGVREDARLACPGWVDSHRDFETIHSALRQRGLGFITLDLPALDSVLTDGLESGILDPRGNFAAVRRGTKIPRLFGGLWLGIFDENGILRSEPCHNAIFFLRQLCCLGKKLHLPTSAKREELQKQEFLNVDWDLPNPTLDWENGICRRDCNSDIVHFCDLVDDAVLQSAANPQGHDTESLLNRVQLVADWVTGELGIKCEATSWWSYTDDKSFRTKHGPGAVALKSRNGIDKFDFRSWSTTLQRVLPYELVAFPAIQHAKYLPLYDLPSRLLCVPKTAKGPRLIAAEPAEKQYTQQMVRDLLECGVRRSRVGHFIDFRRQDLSADLVKGSSLDRSLATVDLSSASDRLSAFVVERAFRRNPYLLELLSAVRTGQTLVPLSRGNVRVTLKKFASQGAAVTFPVQSLVFLIIALAASMRSDSLSEIRRLKGKVRVFGDDIIVPNHGYEKLVYLLTLCGLKVNGAKSFTKGHFRESCGADYYAGSNVTPVKPQWLTPDTPESRQALLDTANNLYVAGCWNAAARLASLLPRRVVQSLPVVPTDSGLTGLVSYTGGRLNHLPSRWNDRLHVNEYRCWTLTVRNETRDTDDSPRLYRYYLASRDGPVKDYSPDVLVRAKPRDRLAWVQLPGVSSVILS